MLRSDTIADGIVRTVKAAVAPLVADIAALRVRLAGLEAHVPIVGPAGAQGERGEKGERGERGIDGFGFDDLTVSLDGRTLLLSFARDGQRKDFPITLPLPIHHGVFVYGKDYELGDEVLHSGSTWRCVQPTQLPPRDGVPHWQLVSKRGRDGRDRRNP